MFLEAAKKAAEYTNLAGRKCYGIIWNEIDETKIIQFHSIVIWMSVRKRKDIRSYFSSVDGDPFILAVGMSRNDFLRIYYNFKLFDPAEAKSAGTSDRYSHIRVQLIVSANIVTLQ